MKNVLILGATGRTGRAVIEELALNQNINLTAALRIQADSSRLPSTQKPIATALIDLANFSSLEHAIANNDVIVNAIRLKGDIAPKAAIELDQQIRKATDDTSKRLIVTVGGAGALKMTDGRLFWTSPFFPTKTISRGRAHPLLRQHLEKEIPKSSWAYLIPPPAHLPLDKKKTVIPNGNFGNSNLFF